MHRFAHTRVTLTIVASITLIATILIPAAARVASAAPAGSITEYPLPSVNSYPNDITKGPDGALWFDEGLSSRIGRITTSGQVTEYPLPQGDDGSNGITTGPDGALWFLDGGLLGCAAGSLCSAVDRMTTSGQLTRYVIPTPNSQPEEITTGPDGALWFTESTADKIGRITTSGTITEYPLPSGNHGAWGITTGPDGAVWFTDYFGDAIGRLTTSGQVTEYPVLTPNSNPLHIATGPDGALWFTESTNQRVGNIGRITTAGTITEYPLPVDNVPGGIAVGPDGALWFTVQAPTAGQTALIGSITTAGTITEYPVPTPNSAPAGITLGPDGALWFTENQASQIGRITASTPPPPPPPSYQLLLTPTAQTTTIGSGQGLVTATVRDAATGAPAANVTLSFRVESGPNTGTSGNCFPSSCTTDANGQVDWGYRGTAVGVDTVQVWLDTNGNGSPDAGEPQATASVGWAPPSTTHKSPNWAGYVLHSPPLQPVSAQITVPTLPATCPTTGYSSFWVGFDGANKKDTFLPQVGFEADCLAGHHHTPCSGTTSGPNYYMFWEINPTTGQHAICGLPVAPGDRVDLTVQPGTTQVIMSAVVTSADGTVGPATWSQTFSVKKPTYSTMECVAEDTLRGNGPASFATFSPTEFDNCSAILDYRAGSTLEQWNIYTVVHHQYRTEKAETGPITANGTQLSFTVTRVNG